MTDTIPAVVRAAAAFGDREALVAGDRRVSYGSLVAGVRQAAAALVAHGVGPGDRVAVWAPNGLEWLLAALGTQYVGAVKRLFHLRSCSAFHVNERLS